MTEQEIHNVKLVNQLNEYVNTRNYKDMPSLFSADFKDNNPAWQVDNVNGLIQVIQNAVEDFDLHNEIIDTIAAEDKVFIHVKNNGVHQKVAFGVEPTQKATSMSTFEIFRFENEKIVERWVISDVLALVKQVGVEFPQI